MSRCQDVHEHSTTKKKKKKSGHGQENMQACKKEAKQLTHGAQIISKSKTDAERKRRISVTTGSPHIFLMLYSSQGEVKRGQENVTICK